jgi:ATP synthase F1 delta subunit
MQVSKSVIASKYARAWLDVMRNEIAPAQQKAIQAMLDFMGKRRDIPFFLSWPAVPLTAKLEFIDTLYTTHAVDKKLFEPLTKLLAAQKRLFLLPDVFQALMREYKKIKQIIDVIIASSVPLTAKQRSALEAFTARKTGCTVVSTYNVEPALIAGVRIQGDTYVWEHSIEQQLDDVRRTFVC